MPGYLSEKVIKILKSFKLKQICITNSYFNHYADILICNLKDYYWEGVYQTLTNYEVKTTNCMPLSCKYSCFKET